MKSVIIVFLVSLMLILPFIVAPNYKLTITDYYISKTADGFDSLIGPIKGEPLTFTFKNKYELLHDVGFKLLPMGSYGYSHPASFNPLFSDETYIFDFDAIPQNKFNITFNTFRDRIKFIAVSIGSIGSTFRSMISGVFQSGKHFNPIDHIS